MIRVSGQIVVDRPVEDIWAFLMDPTNQAKWQTSAIATRNEPPGPAHLGTRYIETRRLLGRTFDLTFEVIRFDPPRHSAVELLTGPVRGGASYNLEPMAEGTRVTFAARLDTGGLFRLTEPVLRARLSRELSGYLANLKRLVEEPAAV